MQLPEENIRDTLQCINMFKTKTNKKKTLKCDPESSGNKQKANRVVSMKKLLYRQRNGKQCEISERRHLPAIHSTKN